MEEEALIQSFVVASKRDRLVELLANPKRRHKALASLAHFGDLDERCVVPLAPSEHNHNAIEQALRARGARESCYVISEDSAIDRQRMPLSVALNRVIGRGMGSVLSCIPGVLAFFEGEGPSDRCILARRAT